MNSSINIAEFGDGTTGLCQDPNYLDITQPLKEAEQNAADIAEAEQIYTSGKALEYICESCCGGHAGDKRTIELMVLSYAGTLVKNAIAGIHLSISGNAGSGKSHAAKVVEKHLPNDTIVNASQSSKALFYNPHPDGTIFVLDDQELNLDIQELIKNATTHYEEGAKRETVENGVGKTLSTPKRCIFWTVKANITGDEQTLSRQYCLWSDNSMEQKINVKDAIGKRVNCIDKDKYEHSNTVSKLIWTKIQPKEVVIPYYDDIIFRGDALDARNIILFTVVIQAAAIMDGSNRRLNNDGRIEANMDDFTKAMEIHNALCRGEGGSITKFSKPTMKVVNVLLTKPPGTYTTMQLRKEGNISPADMTNAGRGRKDSKLPFLADVPGVTIVWRSEIDGGGSTQMEAIKWDPDAYETGTALDSRIMMNAEHIRFWREYEKT